MSGFLGDLRTATVLISALSFLVIFFEFATKQIRANDTTNHTDFKFIFLDDTPNRWGGFLDD